VSYSSSFGLQPASQLKLNINPPPAIAEAFKKELLFIVVLTCAIVSVL